MVHSERELRRKLNRKKVNNVSDDVKLVKSQTVQLLQIKLYVKNKLCIVDYGNERKKQCFMSKNNTCSGGEELLWSSICEVWMKIKEHQNWKILHNTTRKHTDRCTPIPLGISIRKTKTNKKPFIVCLLVVYFPFPVQLKPPKVTLLTFRVPPLGLKGTREKKSGINIPKQNQ